MENCIENLKLMRDVIVEMLRTKRIHYGMVSVLGNVHMHVSLS